ncbi:MAG: hypothetical protein IPN68_17475 [Bacteroidetes bacterium]|nr:hypothetical protein [Bacteroidota bacterium]
MAKITFLIGAGASAEALSLVVDFKNQLEKYSDKNGSFYKTFSDLYRYFSPIQARRFKDYFIFFTSQIEKVVKQLNSITIDQYAKNLFDTDQQGHYEDLKCLLSAFFALEQLQSNLPNINFDDQRKEFISPEINNRHIDPRYRFLWSILVRGNNIPNRNVSIISWNYDLQPELSYEDYFWNNYFSTINQEDIPFKIGELFQTIPRSSVKKYSNDSVDKFSITKLNGVAGFYHQSTTRESLSSYLFGKEPVTLELIYAILEDYCFASPLSSYHTTSRKTTLKFAWENNHNGSEIVNKAKERTQDTEVLVIIGYSFPDYNREIDNEILSNMTSLKSIYIMDNASNITARVKEIKKMNLNNIKVHKHPYLNKFVIPNELKP